MLEDAFEKKRVGYCLPQPSQVCQICRHPLGCGAGLEVTAHVIPNSAFQAPVAIVINEGAEASKAKKYKAVVLAKREKKCGDETKERVPHL